MSSGGPYFLARSVIVSLPEPSETELYQKQTLTNSIKIGISYTRSARLARQSRATRLYWPVGHAIPESGASANNSNHVHETTRSFCEDFFAPISALPRNKAHAIDCSRIQPRASSKRESPQIWISL